jgi:AI-2 transport protein TqsA
MLASAYVFRNRAARLATRRGGRRTAPRRNPVPGGGGTVDARERADPVSQEKDAVADATRESRFRDVALRRMAAILVVVASIWLLRATAPVLLPLAFALFLIGIFWPLQRRLLAWMPRTAAMLVTLTVFLLVGAAFGWALYESISAVAERAPSYQDQLSGIIESVRQRLGLTPSEGGGIEGRVRDYAVAQSRQAASLIGGVILVLAYFVLGLLEVVDFRRKMDVATGHGAHRGWKEPVHRIARDFQSYMVVRTGVGLLTGLGTGIAAWVVGLEFALLWGVLNFLLNYIPTLGSILGVIPPVLFGLVQGGWTLGLLTLVAVGTVQLVMGTFVDPKLQGHYLRLSPLVVLFSVAFWEWVWGIPGAFIGVPMTVGLVIACARFESTRWIAVLLSDVDEDGEPQLRRVTRPAGETA